MPTDVARATAAALEPLLAAEPRLASLLPPGWVAAAARFAALLVDANARLNLTRVVEPAAIARDHLLDAVAALPRIDASGARLVVDLGSGGGVPAIPLALARPDLSWTLVDSVGKKAAALEACVEMLGLHHVRVVPERLELLGRQARHRATYHLATARACAPLPVLVELALPLVAHDGRLLAWKGPLTIDGDEMQRGRAAAEHLGGAPPVVLPTGIAALGGRTLVEVVKDRETSSRYPRRPGDARRQPLG